MFSEISDHFNGPLNVLYKEQQLRLQRGPSFVDLISGNVNAGGLTYPEAALRRILQKAATRSRVYRPDPLGQPAARQAIERYYAEQGVRLQADQIVLTPGTSLSYWYAFKLLANLGDEILCPKPSYPLFESIAALSGVRLTDFPLRFKDRWTLDLEQLEARVTSRTRAIVLVSPHNPTGAVATARELDAIGDIAARHQLPVIFDEVFCPFRFQKGAFPRPLNKKFPLVFLLNGFSKMFALPGMKIGWMALQGDTGRVQKALKGLEMMSDTFLPVHEIAQAAVPGLFQAGRRFLETYTAAIHSRAVLAQKTLAQAPTLSVDLPEGGFHLTVRHSGEKTDETIVLDLLRKENVLVHPGYFYDLDPGYFVVSFVQKETVLKRNLTKIARYFKP